MGGYRLKVCWFFLFFAQTGRQHIQGCSIIHVWGFTPSPFTSHPTRLTRPSQYYQGDVCLHRSDRGQENSSLGSDDCQSLMGIVCRPPAGGIQVHILMNGLGAVSLIWESARRVHAMHNKGWRDSFTVLVTLAGQPGFRRSTFILFFGISLRAAHTFVQWALNVHKEGEVPCQQHYLYSPSLCVMERESALVLHNC